MTLKNRFLEAVSNGELGQVDDFGVSVSLKQFKSFFTDVKSDYVNSFLPSAVIETGQFSVSHTKFLFRIRKGEYRIHPDAITEHQNIDYKDHLEVMGFNTKIEEAMMQYQAHRIN